MRACGARECKKNDGGTGKDSGQADGRLAPGGAAPQLPMRAAQGAGGARLSFFSGLSIAIPFLKTSGGRNGVETRFKGRAGGYRGRQKVGRHHGAARA